MYKKRIVKSDSHWVDPDGLKIYTITMSDSQVDQDLFKQQLARIKESRSLDWSNTPGFVIFHEGKRLLYLVLCWWGNDNELFTSVSVYMNGEWVIDSNKFSFCLYDLEIIWAERNFFVETVYCAAPDINLYRSKRFIC